MTMLPDVSAESPAEKPSMIGPVVDSDRPWPGLFPFKEDQQNYFFGRDDEIDELLHCVKRETVTMLFSKSGLGKSSLLQAGLFPRLREGGFLPVYVRFNYSEVGEPLISQIKSAIEEAIRAGDFAEVSVPTEDESLWEYLHRCGGNIIDHSGNVVCPVLALDQFEEVFTLGASTEAAREMRDRFLDCFAQLVENSIPQDLRDRLVENPKLAKRFDFTTAGCRIVVSLREDYLPKLERLRSLVPSLVFATSRMRLTEMNGEQALLAVSNPNPQLVTHEVADRIVRFIARDTSDGQQKLVNLEVPPPILSLFCRELSIKRGAAAQITEELVSGNATTIIDDFYHRCVDLKPAPLRRMIEDKLVTKWGYRDNIDLKQAKEELEQAGIAASALDDLVNERLLHVEEYRGTPRIELTHDVLIQPVTRSREKWLQEEALEKAREQERSGLAEAQKESRARRLHALLGIALVAGLVLVIFLGVSVRLWQKAEKSAEIAKKNAEMANEERIKADKLKDIADAERKKADESARATKVEKDRADSAAQAARKAEKTANERLQTFNRLSTQYAEQCDRTSQIFSGVAVYLQREPAGEQGVAEAANAFSKMYESLEDACVKVAKQLHNLNPSNIQVTEYLGAVYLGMAESAEARGDNGTAKEYCTKAVQMADALQGEPASYKSRLVAAKTYGGAGYYLSELKEPGATQTMEKGIAALTTAEREPGTASFDARDWDTVANVYFYRAFLFSHFGDHGAAADFYQRSFQAESKAVNKDPRLDSLVFAMGRARDVGDEQTALQDTKLAHEWYNKAHRLAEERIARLSETSATPTDLKSQKELASAYADSAIIEEKLNDFPSAVNHAKSQINIYLDLREKSTDLTDTDRQELSNSLATAYGSLAWFELLARRNEDALEHSRTGFKLDPNESWIRVNEAHALLFTGRVKEANDTYLSLKGKTYKNRDLVTDVQEDFQKLCEMKYVRPEMAGIAQSLGIGDAKLSSCLAAADAGGNSDP
jgi:hypothetical protein